MSWYGSGKTLTEGMDAEEKFKLLAESKGYTVYKTRKNVDRLGKYDFFIEKNNTRYKIEVKGRKKSKRQHLEFMTDEIWVEFQNGDGYPGWLYGQSDFIAQRTEEGTFLLIKREYLKDLSEKLIDRSTFVNNANQALHKAYKRFQRNDIIGKLLLSDLDYRRVKVWKI